MSRPFVKIFNAETQEEITREMNDAEYAQHLIDLESWEQEEIRQAQLDEEKAAKRAAKAEALAALGLSQEVINLLAD